MLVEDIKKYCISKHKAYEEFPFGDVPICYKLNGKIFAQIYPYPEDYKITLKCTADAGQFYRMIYPGKVVRGYHCPPVQQPYWNTIYLDDFSDEELLNMIDHAYQTVFNSFSKKVQKQIMEGTNNSEKYMIGKNVTVTVDRPLGSYHPEHKDMYYPINYGYVEGIMAADGEEQDAYILGVDEAVEKFTGKIIAIVHRHDDIEEKWVVAPEGLTFTKEEIREQLHFQEQYFHSEIVM
ncbi:MAG: MmcQ/YjbR family DNA-binding protein [Lachnospiraceae bacterium]|nr:MmcQ/YjbR family DNA-binding protein [Lachnospiraceae bacterium]